MKDFETRDILGYTGGSMLRQGLQWAAGSESEKRDVAAVCGDRGGTRSQGRRCFWMSEEARNRLAPGASGRNQP